MTDVFSAVNRSMIQAEPIAAGSRKVCLGFSLRTGGKSGDPFTSLNLGLHVNDNPETVRSNRQILAAATGFPLEKWICAEQVHGTELAVVSAREAGAGAKNLASVIKGVDGLMTMDTDLLLALCFADCVPVYFYVTDPPAVAILHAGWRGTVNKGAAKMIDLLVRELNLGSANAVHAVIGPAIGRLDYEIDERVFTEVSRLDPEVWRSAVTDLNNGHYLLGLQELNRNILVKSGVPASQIKVTGYTTFSRPDLFFSYRRDQKETGRMMGFIGMKNEGELQH